MSSVRKNYTIALVWLFSIHGLLYYIFPEQHYSNNVDGAGWISQVKYIFLLAALPGIIETKINKASLPWFLLGSILTLTPIFLLLNWTQSGNTLLLQYATATFGFYFAPFFIKHGQRSLDLRKFLLTILILSFLATIFEVLTGGLSANFSRSGFRSAGPFINPNNTGIVIALTATSLHFLSKKASIHICIVLLTSATLVATGSKTAAAAYLAGGVVMLIYNFKQALPHALTTIAIAFAIGISSSEKIIELLETFELRELSGESGEIRRDSINSLLSDLANEPISAMIFGSTNTSRIDNTYLDILSFGGLLLFLTFLIVQILSIAICIKEKDRHLLILHILFLLAFTTTNIARLWPTGYIYWLLVGITFYNTLLKKPLYKINRNPTTENV